KLSLDSFGCVRGALCSRRRPRAMRLTSTLRVVAWQSQRLLRRTTVRPNPITTRDLFVRRFFYERRFSMILDWLREKLVEAETRLAAVTQQEAEVLDA